VGPAQAQPEKKEMIASDILFREGLNACKNAATRAFIQTMGVSHEVGKSHEVCKSHEVGKSQATIHIVKTSPTGLTTQQKEMSYFSDQLMARRIGAVRKKSKQSTMDSFMKKQENP
jgi:hypothetical protein